MTNKNTYTHIQIHTNMVIFKNRIIKDKDLKDIRGSILSVLFFCFYFVRQRQRITATNGWDPQPSNRILYLYLVAKSQKCYHRLKEGVEEDIQK